MTHVLVHFRRYFLTGLLVITPIWGTYLILRTLLTTLDGILGDALQKHLVFYLPGFGIMVLVALILTVGLVATNFLGRELVRLWEKLLHRVPLVRNVYSVMKSIVDAISLQQKAQFNRVALVEFPQQGNYSIAFVTGEIEQVRQATGERLVNVYVPTTPNPTSGYLIFVPEHKVIPLPISVEDGMKVIISGGFFVPKSTGKPPAADAAQAFGSP